MIHEYISIKIKLNLEGCRNNVQRSLKIKRMLSTKDADHFIQLVNQDQFVNPSTSRDFILLSFNAIYVRTSLRQNGNLSQPNEIYNILISKYVFCIIFIENGFEHSSAVKIPNDRNSV